jgi:hypothetical protein
MVVTRAPFAGFARGSVRWPLVLPYTNRAFRHAFATRMRAIPQGDRATTELTVRVED